MFAEFTKEPIVLVKATGEEIEVKALVQPDMIFVDNGAINIEEDR